jgi:hypothetical protein
VSAADRVVAIGFIAPTSSPADLGLKLSFLQFAWGKFSLGMAAAVGLAYSPPWAFAASAKVISSCTHACMHGGMG